MEIAVKEKSFFSKARDLLWPIYGNEHKIWLPMASMVGLILFNYTIARNMKDGLVVTATKSSEIIPYLKGALVLPASIGFFLIYSKLSSMLSKRSLFYVIVGGFLGFFALFAAVLYPLRDFLHPTTTADFLENLFPAGLKGLVSVYRYWTFSLFYTMAELWGVAVSALMFWQFANDVIRVTDAKRFYAHFYLLANVFVAISGLVLKSVKGTAYLTLIIMICGVAIMALYYYLNHYVFDEAYLAKVASERKSAPKKKKVKMSVMDGVKYIFRSKYLGLIALLVISYGITINLVEVTWKNQVGMQFPNADDYTAFMGNLSLWTGIGTIIAIFLGSILVRTLGWRVAALATPLVLGITGILFFFSIISPAVVEPLTAIFGITPLLLGVYLGLGQNVLSKSTKYALFDPTKEMAYIPLDDESKMRGKAAVDVVANRFGKSGGGYIQIALFNLVGAIGVIAPYLALIFAFFAVIWVFAVFALSIEFKKACEEQEAENA